MRLFVISVALLTVVVNGDLYYFSTVLRSNKRPQQEENGKHSNGLAGSHIKFPHCIYGPHRPPNIHLGGTCHSFPILKGKATGKTNTLCTLLTTC